MDLKDFYKASNTKKDGNTIHSIINLNTEHPIYKGHFPENPVLPGIMQIEIIKDILKHELDTALHLQKVSSIKYLNLITPEISDLQFELNIKPLEDVYKIKCVIKKDNLIYTKFSGQFSLIEKSVN